MIGVHAPLNSALDPGTVIGFKCGGFGGVPLVTSTRPPTDIGANLVPTCESD